MKKIKTKHKQSKYFTIMLVPSSSAKVRRLHIPYWVLSALGIPFLCILVLVVLFQTKVVNLENLLDQKATSLSETIEEKGILRATIDSILSAGQPAQPQSPTEVVQPQEINEPDEIDYEELIAELLAGIEGMSIVKQNIITAFNDLAELEIPFRFDENTLNGGVFQAVGGAYTGNLEETLAELAVVVAREISDMHTLAVIAEELEDYFRARPNGWPVDSQQVGSEFGNRVNPFTGRGLERHDGIDIGVPVGSGVYATAYGVVSYAGWNSGGYGYLVVIQHGHDYTTFYAHNSSIVVTVGEEVERGQLIALSGNTGRSTSPHCHYEVRLDDIPQNPREYLN